MIQFVATITVNGLTKWSFAFRDGGQIQLPPDLAEALGKKPDVVQLHVESQPRSVDEVRAHVDAALHDLRSAEHVLSML